MSAPGFFGKLVSHGDFVTRRLPPGLVEAWDGWLQQCIHASRQQLGDGWLEHYLTSPVWRFAIGKGVLGEQAWAGVMMPSVDRVGRYFPLMIAAPGSAGTGWYDALEDLARSALDTAFVLEEFDLALSTRLPPAAGDAFAEVPLHGHSLWWTDDSPEVESSLLSCEGMPPATSFAAMLDGSWKP